MKRAFCILAVAGMAVAANAQSMTQNASMTPAAGFGISCGTGVETTENSWLRSFNLASFGITSNYQVTSVDFAVETSNVNTPITVRLYAGGLPNTFAGLGAPIATANVVAGPGNLYSLNVPIAALVNPNVTPNLTMEIFAADLRGTGGLFYPGANDAGQTAPCYIASASCGLPNPTDLGAIGFPTSHIIMRVNGVPAPASAMVLGLAGLAATRRRR